MEVHVEHIHQTGDCVIGCRCGDTTTVQLSPSLYPVLLILGRLCPSVAEGFNSCLRLEELVPFIIT